MKKFFLKLFAFALSLMLPFVFYFVYMQSFPAVSTTSLMGISSEKLTLVQNIDKEKIVVVGGSNVAYNIAAQQLSEAFSMPAFNMGTTAYLGLDFFITQLKSYANPGDIVILSLENSVYTDAVDYQTVWMAIENHENMTAVTPVSYIPDLTLGYYQYAQLKQEIIQNGAHPLSAQEGYYAAGFNEYGDYAQPYPDNILQHLYNTQDTWRIDETILEPSVLAQLNRLQTWATRNNVHLYLTYAPFNRLALETNANDTTGMQGVLAFETLIQEQCTIPWLGSYSESIMEAELFFDSNNHLNEQGRDIRTAALIQDLQNTQLALPQG